MPLAKFASGLKIVGRPLAHADPVAHRFLWFLNYANAQKLCLESVDLQWTARTETVFGVGRFAVNGMKVTFNIVASKREWHLQETREERQHHVELWQDKRQPFKW